MRLLPATAFAVMPWKNGGGVTREIVVEPDPAHGAAYLWRLSLATIGEDGPFSCFPGFERIIVPVTGDGLVLTHAPRHAAEVERTARITMLAPYRFSGDDATTCRALTLPCDDFNVIFRRDAVDADVRVVAVDAASASEIALPTRAHAHFLWNVGPAALTVTRGASSMPINAGDVLRLDASELSVLQVTPPPGAASPTSVLMTSLTRLNP